MIQKILSDLNGRRLTEFLGVFIFNTDIPREAVALYLPNGKETWVGITANGRGRFKSFSPLADLYNAPEIGFSFAAPLSILFGNQEYYNYVVTDASCQEYEYLSKLIITFTNRKYLEIVAEDDSITVSLS